MATLLIIEDSDAHRAEIRAAVEKAAIFGRILEASDGVQGLKLFMAESVDLVVCDLEMPGLDGEKLLRVKDSSPGGDQIPFLFVTASQDLGRKARLLEQGACDAIAKPFLPADLVARLKLHLKIKLLQEELVEKNKLLARLSTTDELTGLRNRRFLNGALRVEFMRANRYETPLTVLMADLDHFKEVNDRFGHPAGDAVLRGVSEFLLANSRVTDVTGRYGGEEFLVILAQSPTDGGAHYADLWRAQVEQSTFEAPGGESLRVTLSIGVASYCKSMRSPEDLVALADAALYRAKQKGRNRVEVAA